jgi:hypothetical protein
MWFADGHTQWYVRRYGGDGTEDFRAVTFRAVSMAESVRFYRDVLGMEIIYGGEGGG